MKEPRDNFEKTIADMSVLYELALAVGRSSDLRRNCDIFLKTLMARKNLGYAAVWLNSELLSPRNDSGQPHAVLVYAEPEFYVQQRELPLSHPIFRLLRKETAVTVAAGDPLFTEVTTEKNVRGGVWALLSLNHLGVLKLLSYTRKEPFSEEDLNYLRNVIGKFADSIHACLDHQRLQEEVARRREAEEALRKSQEQLVEAQKMEALGRLAGGIAHDFNNLLTTILGYGRLAMGHLYDKDPVRDDLAEVIHAGERAVELTSQLLTLGRRRASHPRPVNPNSIIADTDRLLRRTLGEDIEIATVLGENLGGIIIDPAQLQQVIMNLAINARDAMPDGGKLTIETSLVDLDEAFCKGRAELSPGTHVKIVVADTGTGMTPEVRRHVFEPFFTTKETGRGSGLGLSTVYGIVHQAGGWIDIESAPGEGTRVILYFARREELAAEVLPDRRAAETPRGTETILVVEDEESVRMFTVKVLQELGYNVLQAGNGGEALLLFDTYRGPIHLVLTDVVMPLMNGKELVRRLRRTGREFKVLYVSGFSDEVFAEKDSSAEAPLLQKPYTGDRLGRVVRSVLDGEVSGILPGIVT